MFCDAIRFYCLIYDKMGNRLAVNSCVEMLAALAAALLLPRFDRNATMCMSCCSCRRQCLLLPDASSARVSAVFATACSLHMRPVGAMLLSPRQISMHLGICAGASIFCEAAMSARSILRQVSRCQVKSAQSQLSGAQAATDSESRMPEYLQRIARTVLLLICVKLSFKF